MITRTDTVKAWADPAVTPRAISKRFHGMLLRDFTLHERLMVLLDMFAEAPPRGTGRYRHHDGCRT